MPLAGNQINMLNVNITSAHRPPPLRQRGTHRAHTTVTHSLALATLEQTQVWTHFPCVLHRTEERENWKVKQETAFEQTNVLVLMPLVAFKHLGQLIFYLQKCFSKSNRRNS